MYINNAHRDWCKTYMTEWAEEVGSLVAGECAQEGLTLESHFAQTAALHGADFLRLNLVVQGAPLVDSRPTAEERIRQARALVREVCTDIRREVGQVTWGVDFTDAILALNRISSGLKYEELDTLVSQ